MGSATNKIKEERTASLVQSESTGSLSVEKITKRLIEEQIKLEESRRDAEEKSDWSRSERLTASIETIYGLRLWIKKEND